MPELERYEPGGAVAATGGIIDTAVKYVIVVAQLVAASVKLRGLSEQVRHTYDYVEDRATDVDRLADQMSRLTVDVDTVGEHHEAATVMRSVLAEAEAMAADTEDLSAMFALASTDHQAEYGPVAYTANSMPVPMADAEFYSNR